VEDGGGAATSAREVEDEGVVKAGVWWPRVSSSRVRASRTCRKVGEQRPHGLVAAGKAPQNVED
jgi:hypothetical protein